jgi:hypothetical protein
MRNKITEAISQAAKDKRDAILARIKNIIINSIKGIQMTVSLFSGILEVKFSGSK